MKYGESTFDILYLLTAIILGIMMLIKSKSTAEAKMGSAVLILGAGDAFHLIPRVMNYFSESELSLYLGAGKFITSLTMTVFYVFMYYIYLDHYKAEKRKSVTAAVYIFTVLRFILCLFPQNGWLDNRGSVIWGIIRNIPFVILGAIIVCLYFGKRKDTPDFRNIWLYVLLSFLFYIPVAVFASVVPMLGMLMLPKTVCYILIIIAFFRYTMKQGGKTWR